MRVKQQFSRFAKSYETYSTIQQKGAKLLAKHLPKDIGVVADLGSGSGNLYKEIKRANIKFSTYYCIDFSREMLKLHPKEKNVKFIVGDFNDILLFNKLKALNLDTILSASALQWAKDLEFTISKCANIAPFGAFFIFSSNTFKTLHQVANLKSPIHSKEKILKTFNRYYKNLVIKEYNFNLEFSNTLQMLRYIKKSGVSGGVRNLGYKEIKDLINKYPLNYLEFETLLILGERKWR